MAKAFLSIVLYHRTGIIKHTLSPNYHIATETSQYIPAHPTVSPQSRLSFHIYRTFSVQLDCTKLQGTLKIIKQE